MKQTLKVGPELEMKDILPFPVLIPDVWMGYLETCQITGEEDPEVSWVQFWSERQVEHFFLREQGRAPAEHIDTVNQETQSARDLVDASLEPPGYAQGNDQSEYRRRINQMFQCLVESRPFGPQDPWCRSLA